MRGRHRLAGGGLEQQEVSTYSLATLTLSKSSRAAADQPGAISTINIDTLFIIIIIITIIRGLPVCVLRWPEQTCQGVNALLESYWTTLASETIGE